MPGNDKDLKIGITADTSGAEQAKAALEGVKAAAEGANAATTAATGGSSPAESRGFGGQLDVGPSADPEPIRERTEAIEEQAEALEELTDAEAGVIDATDQLDKQADKPDGFKMLFDQQRLQAIGKEVEKLGGTVGDLAREFMDTEAGKRFFGGLSEEAQEFGSIALQTGAAVVQGWSEGGPIGAALAGLNVLVKEVGDSFLAVARAEEQAVADLAAETDRLAKRTKERNEIAADRAVEEAFRREGEFLGDQTEQLERQNRLLAARRDLNRAEQDLQDEQDLASGAASPEEIRIRKIRADAAAEAQAIKDREKAARDAALAQELEVQRQENNARRIADKDGTFSEEFQTASKGLAGAQGELRDRQLDAAAAAEERDLRLRELEKRTAEKLQAEALRNREAAERDSESRAREAARRRFQEEREGLGSRIEAGEGRLDASARDASGRFGEVAGRRGAPSGVVKTLEEIANKLADGTNTAELQRIKESFARATQGLGGATIEALRDMLAAQEAQAKEIDKLRASMKKLKTPGG